MNNMLLKISLCLLFCTVVLNAQNIFLNDWKIHTTMHNSLCAISDAQNNIWVGSVGGIIIYHYDGTETSLNAGNKLLAPTVTTMISISKDYIMAGTESGVLELINIHTLECEHITAIKDYGFSDSRINDFCLLDDNTLLIAGNFGMAEFNLDKKIFTKSIYTIGDYSKNTSINNIILHNDSIYVSTSTGIAFTSIYNQINVPTNWKTLRYGSSLNYQNAKIIICNSTIFVNLHNNIYRLVNNIFEIYLAPLYDNYFFTDICISENKLVITDIFQVITIDDIEKPEKAKGVFTNWSSQNNGIAVLNNDNIEIKFVLLLQKLGCEFIKADLKKDSTGIKTPNTPLSSYFGGLSIDKNGILYAVTDNSQIISTWGPFMSFNDKKWTNFSRTLSSFQYDGLYADIKISPDNKVYAAAWGGGLCVMNEANDVIYYDEKNSALYGTSTNPPGEHVVCGTTCFDKNGNAWVVNYGGSAVGPMVVMFDQEGNSYGFVSPFNGGRRTVFNMAIDANNTKWIAGHKNGNDGVFYFNEKNTIEDKNDDIWGNITTSSHPDLLTNYFFSCTFDKFTNTIWLGSTNGLSVIVNPNAILTNLSKPNIEVRKNKLLEGQSVSDIFVDPTGNKWIATKNGIWVLSIDGTELLAHFTTANTPLLDNNIQAITINPNNGLVYIGTPRGLFVAQGNILMPQDKYDIKTYPQPYNIRKHSGLIIDGLTPESDIRIVTADGILIRRLITSSKRATWDGRDDNGNLVSPGIYLVLSNSQISNSGGAAKIIVVDY